jgi:hypothetical protein
LSGELFARREKVTYRLIDALSMTLERRRW